MWKKMYCIVIVRIGYVFSLSLRASSSFELKRSPVVSDILYHTYSKPLLTHPSLESSDSISLNEEN